MAFYKLQVTPSGKKLWAYMAAILAVTGMAKGGVFPLNKFLGNFKTHLDSQRIVRVAGGYQLTSVGKDYFQDRFSPGSPQHIDRYEVDQMVRGINTGVGPEASVKIQ
jgi:hypothetical protein